jgi:hypothetical protein
MNNASFSNPGKITRRLLISCFVLSLIPVLNNFIRLSRDMTLGDFSARAIFPAPQYGFLRIPANPSTVKHTAVNRLAADFAQVYFPSQQFSSLINNYRSGYLDPWQRESRYPPLIHFICSISFCKLPYGFTSLIHMVSQVAIFYFVFIVAFRLLKIETDLLLGLLLVNVYLFLTQAGLAWFERGQFSLYVAVSYILMMLGILNRNYRYAILSALFAFVKWTSFPYIFVTLAVLLLNSQTAAERKRCLCMTAAFFFVIVFLLLWFPDQNIEFVKGLYRQEIYETPSGISLGTIIPVRVVKALPIMLILLGYLQFRLNRSVFDGNIPFLTASAIILLTYPTLAYEYSVPSLLFLIPLTCYWSRLAAEELHHRVRRVMKYALFVFIFVASNTGILKEWTQMKDIALYEYLVITAVFLAFPFVMPLLSLPRGRLALPKTV